MSQVAGFEHFSLCTGESSFVVLFSHRMAAGVVTSVVAGC